MDAFSRTEEQTLDGLDGERGPGVAASILAHGEDLFRQLLEHAPDAILIVDRAGEIVFANAQAVGWFGYPMEELLGRPVEFLVPDMHRPDHRRLREQYQAEPRVRPMGAGLDLHVRRKDGSNLAVEISLSPLETADGLLVTAIIRDVSERREAETRIRELNARLEQRTAELEAINQELEAFSYSVSHDLRAPLRAVDGFSQALLEDYGGQLDATAHDYLARIRTGSQRMGRLIDDLLNLSRIVRTDLAPPQRVDLSDIAEGLASELRQRDPDRVVEFVIQPDLCVEGDSHLLQVALENLLGNAWKFTARRASARIEFGVQGDAENRVFFVRDNGAGFDMAYAGKLFGAFQRLHGTAEFPGTGIGLATVKRIIARHGGKVWAEGAVDEGATVYFTLRECGAAP
ncbi:MAG TPA: PAS domain S-box protein [Parasulfuritortus sp.]